MDLTLTDDQQLLADTARELLEARVPMSHVAEMEHDPTGFSPALWKEMAELGWTGLAFPVEVDGEGAGFLEACLVVEEMGRVQLPSPFVPTVLVCGAAVLEHGTDEQRRSRLGAIARGERIVADARAAAGAGWSASGSEVVARRRGDGFLLEGTARFVPYAHVADELVVVAQHDDRGPEGLSAFLVDAHGAGISTEPVETVRADHQHDVRFTAVEVGAGDVLGEVGGGGRVAETLTTSGAAATCAEMVGGAQRVLDMTVEYARERRQFDTPIGAFQAVQHRCADMGVDVLGARLLTYEAIWRISEGRDATEEVAMAKAWTSEAYRRVVASGHQVHGAIGFTREHDLHWYLRHAVAGELAYGDAEHHWGGVADLLGLPD